MRRSFFCCEKEIFWRLPLKLSPWSFLPPRDSALVLKPLNSILYSSDLFACSPSGLRACWGSDWKNLDHQARREQSFLITFPPVFRKERPARKYPQGQAWAKSSPLANLPGTGPTQWKNNRLRMMIRIPSAWTPWTSRSLPQVFLTPGSSCVFRRIPATDSDWFFLKNWGARICLFLTNRASDC